MSTYILLIIGALIGSVGGFFYRKFQVDQKNREAIERSDKMLKDAQTRSKELIIEAKNEAFKIQEEAKQEERGKRQQLERMSERLVSKEDQLDKRLEQSEKLRSDLEQKSQQISKIKAEVSELHTKQEQQLHKVAQLSRDEARNILFTKLEDEMKGELVSHLKKIEDEEKKLSKERARGILADAIQRYAAEVASESTATLVPLASDDMKGRIIGKEGRNINAFEQATGVDVIVDDTPGSIVISGFDPMRRYIAKVTLEKLLVDGRIHPGRIEETVEKAKNEVNESIRELGEKAAYETGVVGLPSNLVKLLGRLHFRISNGQNLLKHSIEVSFLAGALAEEIGADAAVCRKAGLLHSIGRAVDHEIGGVYTHIGRDILKKFGIQEDVIHAVEAHLGDPEAKTVEAAIVEAANAISRARPGAKKDNLDAFIKRMTEMENIIGEFNGVSKVYALQAGAEVRVIVNPEMLDDLGMMKLGHAIARKIETDMKFPGQVKISLIREQRAEAFAQ